MYDAEQIRRCAYGACCCWILRAQSPSGHRFKDNNQIKSIFFSGPSWASPKYHGDDLRRADQLLIESDFSPALTLPQHQQ
jgi:hypothetical protein